VPDAVEVEAFSSIPVPEPAPAAEALPGAGSQTASFPPAAPPGVWEGGRPGASAVAPAGPAGAGVGGPQFFSVGLGTGDERPLTVVFVIDQSESMARHAAADRARGELLRTLRQLTSADQFQIVLYNTSPLALTPDGDRPRLLHATDRHRRLAEAFLRGTLVEGGTDHLAALDLALRLQPDTIVLLTDGDEPGLSARDLATIRKLNRRLAVIHTIEFGDGPQLCERSSLAILASGNSGTYTYVDLRGP
jgi:hypothetical protein